MTTALNTLNWNASLVLGDARTDHTHEEFVALINATTAAPAAEKLATYQALLRHTVAHFAMEERWMRACGIPEDFCHFGQHASVLQVMNEVERRALGGEVEYIDSMIEALVEWFPGHADSMDAGLVAYLQGKGYDTTRETFTGGTTPGADIAVPTCGHHEPGTTCA